MSHCAYKVAFRGSTTGPVQPPTGQKVEDLVAKALAQLLPPEVNVVSRSNNKLDIFAAAMNGHVITAAWEPSRGGWRGWWPAGNLNARPGTRVDAVSRSTTSWIYLPWAKMGTSILPPGNRKTRLGVGGGQSEISYLPSGRRWAVFVDRQISWMFLPWG
jgi:hypothetical protein